ncbi:Alpha-L-fucosidase [Lachnellula suecica]|uniref:alpha-L-fucosidase n=1 Tax=Lachnellula suecica TaxID=602035 RepID=A0A8T9C857_9HELO|nr:Alpha-L-fucosidase [Lachnellula suecica]
MKCTSGLMPALAAASVLASTPEPKYRISPIDGSTIALPTQEQLQFQDKEIGVLIHFEMGTYLDIDGCNNVPSLVPNLTLFDPELLNTDQWMDSATALGAQYATLVAKHNCGFTTWPSQVKFQTRDNTTIAYNYTIAQSPVAGDEVVKSFVESAEKYDVGHGFYYSTVVNNFLNVQNSEVNATSWAVGQVRISNETYDEVVDAQLTELWTNYGSLTEIWFDGGYSATQQTTLENMLTELQPQAVVFNACDVTTGECLSQNPVRWVGTETGEAPIENWSTGITNDGGDPTSPSFCPSVCDTTLQTQDRWFYGVDQPLRPLTELISVYHTSVGRNCMLELDLSPDRSGLIPASYAARYKQLGDFIKSCYDGWAGDTLVSGLGEVVDDGVTDGTLDVPWTMLSNGTSVGHKKIDVFEQAVTVTEVLVNSTFVDTPKWRDVSLHLCDQLVAS